MMQSVSYNSFQIHLFCFKESYDTNYIVPALPALCFSLDSTGFKTTPEQKQNRALLVLWSLSEVRTENAGRFQNFWENSLAALNLKSVSSPKL